MKVLITLFVLLSMINLSFSYTEEEARLLFKQFQEDHQKQYLSSEHSDARFQIFKSNLNLIKQQQEKETGSAEYGVNLFADMTQEEFKEKVLLTKQQYPVHEESRYMKFNNVKDLPVEWDCNAKGLVTPVKNQGSLGSCYIFSAIGNIEGQWKAAGHDLVNLSAEQILECDGTSDSERKIGNCGVYGGWPYLVFKHVIHVGGLATEEEYPYCADDTYKGQQCFPCSPAGYNKDVCGPGLKPPACTGDLCKEGNVKYEAKIVDWKAISTNETEIAQALVELGPLSVALNALQLQFYRKGVFSPILCDASQLDHAVLLTGYGIEPKHIFKKETPYWTVKNSWSEKWGENGFFRIERGTGKCGINTAVATSVVYKEETVQTEI